MRSSRLGLLLAIVVASLLVGCGGSKGKAASSGSSGPAPAAKQGGSLTIARSSDVISLNPQMLTIAEDFITQEAIYAALVRSSANGQSVEPWIARSYTYNSSAKTYVFKLRPNLHFSNGKPLSSKDVAFSIRFAQKGAIYGAMLQGIAAVKTPNSETVEVKLAAPDNLVLPALSFAYVVPAGLNGMNANGFFSHPVSSGAYALSSWQPGKEMKLSKNAYYFEPGRPHLDTIIYRIVPDESARLNELQAGEIGLDEYVTNDQVQQIPSEQLVRLNPASRVVMLLTNNTKPPFDNAKVREAASLAIDRATLRQVVWGGAAGEVTGLIPPGLPDSPTAGEGGTSWPFNASQAKSTLAASGTPSPSVTIVTSYQRGVDPTLVNAVQNELQQAGFRIKTEPKEFASAVQQVLGGQYQAFLLPNAAFLPTAGEAINDYLTLFAPIAGWDTKKIAGMLEQYAAATEDPGRKKAVAEFENYIHAGTVAMPIGTPNLFYGKGAKLTGLQVSPFGTYRADELAVGG